MLLGSTGGVGGTDKPVHLTVQITAEHPSLSQVRAFYLDDGMVVSAPPLAPLAGLGIRRQTDAGRLQLDAWVAEADLPNTERHATTTDGSTYMYTLIFADGRIVEASDVERDPLALRIVDLARRLGRPDTAFPASAWQDQKPLPYRPEKVAVRTLLSETGVEPRADVSMITPAFDPSTFGQPEVAGPEIRCKVLAIDDALAQARSLRAVAVPRGDGFLFADVAAGRIVEIAFELRGPMDTPPRCD